MKGKVIGFSVSSLVTGFTAMLGRVVAALALNGKRYSATLKLPPRP